MNTRITKDLDKAKTLYKDLRLNDAYPILKRLFDRLPFNYIPEHSEYFGMFVRCLYELGRENEIKFYANEFEKLYEQNGDLEIGHQIAYIYTDEKSSKVKYAEQIYNKIIKDTNDENLKVKATLNLATLCQTHFKNEDLLKAIIYSIDAPKDKNLNYLWISWKAITLRNEKKFFDAKVLLDKLIADINPNEYWYAHFTAKVILTSLYLEEKNIESANKILVELKESVLLKPLKTLCRQIGNLEERLSNVFSNNKITVRTNKNFLEIICGSRSIKNHGKTSSEKLLSELLRKKILNKQMIVKTLYDRKYSSETDDKLIYYHVFGVRALLSKIGIPNNCIENTEGSYKLASEITFDEENNEHEKIF